MSDNKVKAKWEKPKLVVLVRGKRQEDVLLICKTGWTDLDAGVTLNPFETYATCRVNEVGSCNSCEGYAFS